MAFADPSVLRFSWPQTRPYTEEDARAFFAGQEQARRRGEELNFAFVDPVAPELVLGGGSLYGIDLAQGPPQSGSGLRRARAAEAWPRTPPG